MDGIQQVRDQLLQRVGVKQQHYNKEAETFHQRANEHSRLLQSYDELLNELRTTTVHPKLGASASTLASVSLLGTTSDSTSTSSSLTLADSVPQTRVAEWVRKLRQEYGMEEVPNGSECVIDTDGRPLEQSNSSRGLPSFKLQSLCSRPICKPTPSRNSALHSVKRSLP